MFSIITKKIYPGNSRLDFIESIPGFQLLKEKEHCSLKIWECAKLFEVNYQVISNIDLDSHVERETSDADYDALSERKSVLVAAGRIYNDLFPKGSSDLNCYIENFATNNGLKIISPFSGKVEISNTTLSENMYLFGEGINQFIVCFSSNWKYGFVSLQIVHPSTRMVYCHVDKGYKDRRIPMQILRDLGIFLHRYLSPDFALPVQGLKNKKIILTNFNFPHIGHNLWNGLSGWSSLVGFGRKLRAMYSQVESLVQTSVFPFVVGEEKGLSVTTRKIFSEFDLEREMPIFLKGDFISREVAASISQGAEEDSKKKGQIRGLFDSDFILLSLRSGNRTVINETSFFTNLIEKILSKTSYKVVIDGMNTSDISSESSHKNISLQEELLFAKGLVEIDPSRIFNIVGCSVQENLVYANAAKAVVAPWGAGLAKYSWVCNKPCFVYSNKKTLTSKPDLRIYDSSSVREGAREIDYLCSELVQDVDSYSDPYRNNFYLLDGASDRVLEFIKRV
ncbi:hypothetical protein [Microbulbifer agarilyticus]